MNTHAHLIFGAAAFARPDAPHVTLAAVIGAMLPDLSLYLMVSWHLIVLGTDPNIVFGQLYFSDAWMNVFRIDNSFILWGVAFGAALWSRKAWLIALTGAALLHLAFDFPLHHDDGRPQFWPLTMWIFESPFSYWDRNHHGSLIGAAEILVCLGLCVYLWRQFKTTLPRVLIVIAIATQVAPGIAFAWLLAG